MASQIDPSVIKDDQPVDKHDLRAQFQIARDEITALQARTSFIRQAITFDTWFDNI